MPAVRVCCSAALAARLAALGINEDEAVGNKTLTREARRRASIRIRQERMEFKPANLDAGVKRMMRSACADKICGTKRAPMPPSIKRVSGNLL